PSSSNGSPRNRRSKHLLESRSPRSPGKDVQNTSERRSSKNQKARSPRSRLPGLPFLRLRSRRRARLCRRRALRREDLLEPVERGVLGEAALVDRLEQLVDAIDRRGRHALAAAEGDEARGRVDRSEEHTSELQS